MFFRNDGYMPELETERLLLRKLVLADARDIYEYGRDAKVAEHVLWDAYTSIGEAKAHVRYMIRRYRACEPASWGIVEKSSGRVIGTIGYMWLKDEHRSAEVGYSMARDCWNQGYMTEALKAVLNYSFKRLHLNRVEAIYETTNPASGKVMEKCGMRFEGCMRQKLRNKGRYVDV
ncbi:MAG: GNAT family N-acetyltransferase, partial [Clostridia bacterium]|nr:GNAT family N-acetyltransferase [Clostridia bacterium]